MSNKFKHRDVVIAYMEGKQIQYLNKGLNAWMNIPPIDETGFYSTFHGDYEYRIKPETRKYRVARYGKSTYTANSDEEAKEMEHCNYFICWLTDWIEYEV